MVVLSCSVPSHFISAPTGPGTDGERRTKHRRTRGRTARNGVYTTRKWFKDYMASLGWTWTPTMHIGSGCTVHLADGELPMGRLIVSVSRHLTAVIDGVIRDTYDPQRGERFRNGPNGEYIRLGGGRCVYGYWREAVA